MSDIEKNIADKFASYCHVSNVDYDVVEKAGDKYLILYVGKINDIYAKNITRLDNNLEDSSPYKNKIYLKQKTPKPWLKSIEIQLLQNVLAESLTIGKSSLKSDFFKKFIPFVGGEEARIYTKTNNVIFGRRGAGKSSLILYACNLAQKDNLPFAWVAMQQFQRRNDYQVIPQVLFDIIEQCVTNHGMETVRADRIKTTIHKMEDKGLSLTIDDVKILLPIFARDFLPFVQSKGAFYIFIDDLHLLHPDIQPAFLSALYSFSRGNDVYLKITSIENLTRLYNETGREGLQPPGDAQIIRLDYNLINPQTAYKHIENILNAYLKYVGIPSLNSLCSKEVLQRLIWVSAGVPRDALYIFNNSIMKAISTNRRYLAITDINMAASDSMTEKEKYINDDVQDDLEKVLHVINDIKDFCLKKIKCNAFLVKINNNDERYRIIKKIVDLRLIHMLHQGITPERAGEKYEAFMLDYAFYTGFRKTPSVKEFTKAPTLPLAKDLRKLKAFNYEARIIFN